MTQIVRKVLSRRPITYLGAALAVITALAGAVWLSGGPLRDDQHPPDAPFNLANPGAVSIQQFAVDLPIDGANMRQLAGFADDIVAGVVTGLREAGDLYGTPASYVDIDVKTTLKGKMSGHVELLAEGGTRQRDGKTEVFFPEGGAPISSGLAYVFATRFSRDKNANIVIPRVGQIALSADEAQDLADTGGAGSGRVSSMRDAVANSIPFRR